MKGSTVTERNELLTALTDAGVTDALNRERILSLFARVRGERDEAVRQLGVMRTTLTEVKSMLRAGRQAEVARRVMRYLDTPIAERGPDDATVR